MGDCDLGFLQVYVAMVQIFPRPDYLCFEPFVITFEQLKQ